MWGEIVADAERVEVQRMTTIRDAIRSAVSTSDAAKCGEIADMLRARGMTYNEIRTLVVEQTGIDPREWEALMLESETAG